MKKVFGLFFLISATFSLASCGKTPEPEPKNYYTVTWKNYDGAILEIDENVTQGTMPKYDGATPTRPSDAQYTYTFSGWDKDITKAIERDTIFTAQYSSVKNDYTVTFDGNGGTLVSGTEVQKVKYPSEIVAPVYEKEDYDFTGWDKNIATITATTTVYAQWKYSPSDDTSLEIDGFTKEGEKLSKKTDNKIVTFSFSNIVHVGKGATWKLYSDIRGQEEIITKTIDLNVGDNTVYINVTARSGRNELYTIVVRRLDIFTITWVDEDGTTPLSTTYVQEDDMPEYDKGTPTKPKDAQYTYTFAGWVPSIVKASSNTTYKASYSSTINKYTVIWKNYNGAVLETDENVPYGTIPSYDGKTPDKPADAQYTYKFDGWDKDITIGIEGDTTFIAQYSSTINTYTVTWKNYDGKVLETDENVPYGTIPKYDGKTPTKPADAQYTYNFKGWDKDIEKGIEGDTVFTAQYNSSTNKYVISWYNGATLLHSEELEYGKMPTYHWTDKPSKEQTQRIRYDWNGWEETITTVTGNAEYHAHFDEVNKYLITYKNYDGTVLQESYVPSDILPTYEGAQPTRPPDAQYTYEPVGWDKDEVKPTCDTVYIYTYQPVVNKYKITWMGGINGDQLLDEKMVAYGLMPTAPTNIPDITEGIYVYTFYSWSPVVTKVTGEATYVAQYKQELVKFNITWKNYDDTVLGNTSVPYGSVPSYSGTPTKVINGHSFEWLGWDKDILPATQDETYKAVFDNDIIFDFIGVNCAINFKTEFTDIYTFDELDSIDYVIKPIGPYTLPDTISVYIDDTLVSSDKYTYEKTTGAFSIASNLGNIRLEVTGV